MSDFDDFSINGSLSGVLPTQKSSLPSTVRNSRSFFGNSSFLPRFYYDFQAQARHHAHRRLGAKPKS